MSTSEEMAVTYTAEMRRRSAQYGYTGIQRLSTASVFCLGCAVGRMFADEGDMGEIHPANCDAEEIISCDQCFEVVVYPATPPE